ncbi:uncharacterized protein LOC131429789 [Malaya genurostris]|uniref:uncharacterized protein LOC131429789 n=1 Tax=Malaya genurostris TaxID=325434 RepID=UPI0026F3B79B|nr:uncharacterized protein LOC131429789 [Malaya genurostris]
MALRLPYYLSWTRILIVTALLLTLEPILRIRCMSVDQDATCSHLDRNLYQDPETAGPMIEEDFRGHITVLYSVAPSKPFLTRRIYKERDPIFFNKILFDEQIELYHTLLDRFESNGFRDVQFIVAATESLHPNETDFGDFDDFLDNATSIAAGHNISVYPNPLNENGTFAMFGLKEFQVYVLDRCSRIAYIIEPPWSLIQYSYVKAAVLSTLYDRPCGDCDVDNFLNSSLPEKKFDVVQLHSTTDSSAATMEEATVPTNSNSTQEDGSQDDDDDIPTEEDPDLERITEEIDVQRPSIMEANMTTIENDPFANLTVSGPELSLPLKIIIPAVHIHFEQPKPNNSYDKYAYIIFQSDKPLEHQHEIEAKDNETIESQSSLREISLVNVTANSTTLRVVNVEWPLDQLREILNTSSIYYDDSTTQVYRKLARYDASGVEELEELSVASQFAAWKRRQAERTEQAKTEKRQFIRKHYERLIQWLNWQFEKS